MLVVLARRAQIARFSRKHVDEVELLAWMDAWPKALCFGRGTTGTMVRPGLTAWLEVAHSRGFQLGSERDKGESHLDVFTSSS